MRRRLRVPDACCPVNMMLPLWHLIIWVFSEHGRRQSKIHDLFLCLFQTTKLEQPFLRLRPIGRIPQALSALRMRRLRLLLDCSLQVTRLVKAFATLFISE
jgi:hypothetical protein